MLPAFDPIARSPGGTVDPAKHERLTSLFLQAADLTGNERDSFLARTCADDPEIRREVEKLLLQDGDAASRATEQLAAPVRAAAGRLLSEARSESAGPARLAHFQIVARLGAGGAGTVFEAHDEPMDRQVALKVLSPALALSERAARRFDREAWITGRLAHPNIVRVYERGEWDGSRFLSMELVRGGSLDEVITSMRLIGRDERLGLRFGTPEYVHWVVRQVTLAARALHFAHLNGIVHRDIKPPNLLLDGEPPMVKIADFGIAMDGDRTRLTTDGQLIGTICYMAPEQILGRTQEIDGRTDVYALGVTLFELLTLEYPHRGETHQRYIAAVLADEARRPREINGRVSRDLEVVIRKALEKDPRHRYATAEDLADDLDNVLHLRPIRARPPGPVDRTVKWVRRKPLQAALLGVLLVGLPTVSALGYRASSQAQQIRATRIQELESTLDRLALNGEPQLWQDVSEGLLDLAPGNPAALRTLAIVNFDRASAAASPDQVALYRRASLGFLDRLIAALPENPWPHGMKADFLRRWERTAEAEEEERLAASLPPATDNQSLYFAGQRALERRDLAGADALFSQVIVARPWPEALVWRARTRERMKRDEEAIQDYQSAAHMKPEDPFPHLELGQFYANRGKFVDARMHLERALALAPLNAQSHEMYADYALKHGRYLHTERNQEAALARFREAEEHARKSLDLEPDRPFSHLSLGASLVEQARLGGTVDPKRGTTALEEFSKARDLTRDRADRRGFSEAFGFALANICDVLLEMRDPDRAIAACREAVANSPDVATPHYNLAGAHALAGRNEEALAELRKDFELGDQDYAYLIHDPWFASLHNDRKFQGLVNDMRRSAETPVAPSSAPPVKEVAGS